MRLNDFFTTIIDRKYSFLFEKNCHFRTDYKGILKYALII